MYSQKPALRRKRPIRQTMSRISTMMLSERHASPVTVIKDYQDVQNSCIEFPGLQQHSNQTVPSAMRLIWLIVILASVTACVLQSSERLTYYLSNPSRVNALILHNRTVKLPVVTICPNTKPYDNNVPLMNIYLIFDKFKSHYMHPENVLELFEKGNITLSEMWSLSKLWISNISLKNYANNEESTLPQQKSLTIKEVYTPIGICHQIIFNSEVKRLSGRTLFVVEMNKLDGDMAKISLTAPEDSPMESYLSLFKGVPIKGFFGGKYATRITESIFRNTSKNPCGKEVASKCLAQCFENIFIPKAAKKLCRLPFMQHSNEISPCHSRVELDEMIAATTAASREFSPEQCNCSRSCRQILYTTDYTEEAQATVWTVEVIVADGRTTLLKEEAAYSVYDLFADLGGSLGLWLGLCFLQVLEFGLSCFSKFWLKFILKKKEQKETRKIGRRLRIVVVRSQAVDTEAVPRVDLPGFRNVGKHESNFWIRVLWLAVSIAASLVNLQQCMQRVVLYIQDPSTVNVYYKKYTSLPLPSIMVCPSRREGLIPVLSGFLLNKKPFDFIHEGWTKTNFRDVFQLATQGQLTIDDLWNISGFTFKHENTSSSMNKNWTSSVVPTILGSCHMFQLNETISNKGVIAIPPLRLVMDEQYQSKSVMTFINEDLDLIKYLIQTDFIEFSMISSQRLETAFRITQLSHRNLQRNPCMEREEVVRCLRECLEKNIIIKIPQGNCRLPFMATNISVCNTTKSMATVVKAALNVVDTFNREDCLCLRACKEYLYTKEYSTIRGIFTNDELVVQLQFWNNEIMVIEEFPGYNGFALFSDLGGFLGLISGMCITNFFEITELLIFKVIIFLNSQYRSKKQKTLDEQQVSHRQIIVTDDFSGRLEKEKTKVSTSRITKNNSRLWNQCIWVLIMLGMLHPCIYMCVDRIQFYMSDPTSSTTYFKRNSTITFPLMVICPEIDQSLYSTEMEELKYEEYWNLSIFPLKSINIKINGKLVWENNNTATDKVLFSMVMTAAGICLVTVPKQPVTYNGYDTQITTSFWLKKPRDSHKSYMNAWMAVFPVEKLPLVKYLSSKDCYFARESKVFSMDISMQVTEVVHRSTRELPCEDSASVISCLTNCIEQKIYSKHGLNCRLPFMPQTKNHHTCQTMEEYLDVKNATRDMYENFNLTDCKCARECRVLIYSVDELVMQPFPSYEHDYFILRIPENTFPKTEDDVAYTFIKLLSDLGGTVGLFFGLGLLQLLAMLADNIQKLKKHC